MIDTSHQAKKDKRIRFGVGKRDVHFSFGNVTLGMLWNIPIQKSGQQLIIWVKIDIQLFSVT